MNFLHYDLQLMAGDIVEVTLDKQANVRLLDGTNFLRYRSGQQHTYYGGLAISLRFTCDRPMAANGTWSSILVATPAQ